MTWLDHTPDADVVVQPIRILWGSKEEICCFAQIEARVPLSKARDTAMQLYSPTHSFMFDEQGLLLHANEAAVSKWRSRGTPICINVHSLK